MSADEHRPEEESTTKTGAREDDQSHSSNRLFLGILYGAAAVLMVGGIVLWSNRNVTAGPPIANRSPAAATTPSMPSASQAHQTGEEDLSATAAAEIAMLRSRLESNPEDLLARKQLALRLLENQHLVDAFEEADKILKTAPKDADALYVEGVVRVAMGQGTKAIDLLDQVLAQHPDHVLALIAKGRAQAGLGDLAAAIATWKQGLKAAGGHQPEIEQLLAQAENDSATAAMPASPPHPTTTGSATGAAPALIAPNMATAPSAAAGNAFDVQIQLAPGAQPAPGSVLFVSLHGNAAGPPAAVKRIANPSFPLEVKLSAADSMMGQPLPDSGNLVVRLDADGDAISRGPNDLEGTAQARAGKAAQVTLGAAGR